MSHPLPLAVALRSTRMTAVLLGLLLAIVSTAQAQSGQVLLAPNPPTLRIGANTRVVGTGDVQLVYGGGALTNNGSLSLAVGTLTFAGPTTYGGSGAATVARLVFGNATGISTLNSLLSVTEQAAVFVDANVNANGQLYLRTDQFPGADLIIGGTLNGTVQGLVTKATATSGSAPYTSQLSTNVSGRVVQYQWQSSADNSAWTNVSGANGPTYAANVTASIYYRCRLTAINSAYDQFTPAQLLTYTPVTPTSQTACRSSAVVLTVGLAGSRYEWYKNGQSAPFKLTEIASIQKGTATASLTLVSVQTTADYYCKVFAANGSFSFVGPYQVVVNYGCTPGARVGAGESVVAEVPLTVTVAPNPVVGEWLRAVVRGAGGEPLTVDLVDMQGVVVRSEHWPVADSEQVLAWDVSTRPAGLYLLRAQRNGQATTVKVVKQ